VTFHASSKLKERNPGLLAWVTQAVRPCCGSIAASGWRFARVCS